MSLDSLKSKLRDLANDLGRLEDKKTKAVEEEGKVQQQIIELQRELDKARNDRQTIEADMAKITPKIHNLENEISQE